MGGLHNWVKFYLEERRGAARYMGPRYKGSGKHDAALNPYFVSGRFTWDLNGKHLAAWFLSLFPTPSSMKRWSGTRTVFTVDTFADCDFLNPSQKFDSFDLSVETVAGID